MSEALGHLLTNPMSFLSTLVMPGAKPFTEADVAFVDRLDASEGSSDGGSSGEECKQAPAAPARKPAQAYCCQRQSTPAPRFLVVGLGNPGHPFTGTRHNIGRDIVAQMQATWPDAAVAIAAAAAANDHGDDGEHSSSSHQRRGSKHHRAGKKPRIDDAPPAAHLEKVCASRVASVSAGRMIEIDAEANGEDSAPPAPKGVASAGAASAAATATTPCTCSLGTSTAAADSSSSSSSASAASSASASAAASSCPPSCRCRILLALPDVFMNLSGKSVTALSALYHVPARHMVLVHDDVSIPLGSVRIRTSGSAGGQNGVASVLEKMGGERACEGMVRIRIGVAPPVTPTGSSSKAGGKAKPGKAVAVTFKSQTNLAKFVMQGFTQEESEVMAEVRRRVQQAILQICTPPAAASIAAIHSAASVASASFPPPPPSCCCHHSTSSSASLAQRLQYVMTRFNGQHIAISEEE